MRKKIAVLGVALLLSDCAGYFDQHPANVRPESEALATVLARQQPPTRVAETVLPSPQEPVVAADVAQSGPAAGQSGSVPPPAHQQPTTPIASIQTPPVAAPRSIEPSPPRTVQSIPETSVPVAPAA